MIIEYSPRFLRRYKKMPPEIKTLAEQREPIFRADPFNHRLNTHKLTGDYAGYWAFRLNRKCRIIFYFAGEDVVHFHTIGGHDIYNH